jgi:hypothetical protein
MCREGRNVRHSPTLLLSREEIVFCRLLQNRCKWSWWRQLRKKREQREISHRGTRLVVQEKTEQTGVEKAVRRGSNQVGMKAKRGTVDSSPGALAWGSRNSGPAPSADGTLAPDEIYVQAASFSFKGRVPCHGNQQMMQALHSSEPSQDAVSMDWFSTNGPDGLSACPDGP